MTFWGPLNLNLVQICALYSRQIAQKLVFWPENAHSIAVNSKVVLYILIKRSVLNDFLSTYA